jgi:hypothetical protein
MRKIVLVFIAVVLTVSGFAQKTADIGIWGGSSTYWGDVKEAPPLQTFNLNFGGYFRYNFNKRAALRLMFLNGTFSTDGIVEGVPWDFKKTAQDLSVSVEINYLEYILGEKKTPFTPYIMGGLGVMYFPYTYYPVRLSAINPEIASGVEYNESVIAPTIPFGFGVKFNLGERIGIGAEYLMRKILSDKLDDLDDPLSFSSTNNAGEAETIKYTDFLHNNDWPGYLGVHVTYKIYLNKKACPAYDRKYW